MVISGGFRSSLPLVSGFGSTFLLVTVFDLSHNTLLIPPLLAALLAGNSPGKKEKT